MRGWCDPWLILSRHESQVKVEQRPIKNGETTHNPKSTGDRANVMYQGLRRSFITLVQVLCYSLLAWRASWSALQLDWPGFEPDEAEH
jgi:hypothetical protein